MNGDKITNLGKRAVFIALCLNLFAGAQYCWSMLGSTLMKEYGWSMTQMTLPYSMMYIVGSLWAIVIGIYIDRVGPNNIIRIGAVANCAGIWLAGVSHSWWVVLFAVGGLMGIASSSIPTCTASTAVKFIPLRYKGLVSGIVSAGIGWTSLYMAPLINRLLAVASIRNTFIIIALVNGIGLFVLSFFLPNPLKYPELTETVKAADSENRSGVGMEMDTSKYKDTVTTTMMAVKTKETWLLFGILACATTSGLMLTSQVTTIASVQAGIANGYILIMAMGVCNGLGRLMLSYISDKIGVYKTWMLLFLVTAGDMIALWRADRMSILLPAVCIMSAFYGGAVPLIWASITDVFGKKYMGTIYGVVTNGFCVSALLGPTIASKAVELTGGYAAGYAIIILFALIGLGFTLYLTALCKEQ